MQASWAKEWGKKPFLTKEKEKLMDWIGQKKASKYGKNKEAKVKPSKTTFETADTEVGEAVIFERTRLTLACRPRRNAAECARPSGRRVCLTSF